MRTVIFLFIGLFLLACEQRLEKEIKQEKNVVTESNQQDGTPLGITASKRVDESKLVEINERIRADIDNPDLYLERSKIYFQIDDNKAAVADIDRAFRIDSTYEPTLLAQSDFFMKRGKVAASMAILEKAKTIYPNSSKVYAKTAEVFLVAKNLEKALKNADLAIKYDKFNAHAYYIKGYTFLEMRDTTRAISSYQTAIEQNPEHFDAYLELGLIFSSMNNPLALDYYKNALEIEPLEKRALYSKGMFEQEHKMYNEAILSYTALIKAHPDFKEAYYNLGYVHMYYLKLYREATKYYTNAIEVDPRYFQAFYNRGYSLELMGDVNNAAKDYRKALSINPSYDLAAKGLTRVTTDL